MTVTIRIPGKGQYGYHEIVEDSAEEALEELKSLAKLGCLSARDFLLNEYGIKSKYRGTREIK